MGALTYNTGFVKKAMGRNSLEMEEHERQKAEEEKQVNSTEAIDNNKKKKVQLKPFVEG